MKTPKSISKGKEYDVRVVRFEKTSNQISSNDRGGSPDWDYMCLGHFDRVTAEALNEQSNSSQSPLQRIGKNQNEHPLSGDNRVFSMYMLKENTADSYFNEFWQPNTKFSSIIRLHCDLTKAEVANTPLLDYLENYFCNLEGFPVKYINKGKLQSRNVDVSYILYDSLELGDAVAVLKSDSIVAMLEVARCLNFNNSVRDTYTYCLIQTQLLQQNTMGEVEKLDNSPVTNETSKDNAMDSVSRMGAESMEHSLMLDYASTRFAIRDAYATDRFLQELDIKVGETKETPKAYFITGTTDLIVEWGPCSEHDFVEYLKKVTQKGVIPDSSEVNVQGTIIQTAFNDVITRIGIRHMNKPTPAKESLEKHTASRCATISNYRVRPNEISFCCDKLKLPSYLPFEHSFRRILGTLESMYHNSVTDDLYNLLYPSTRAMINRLACIKDINGDEQILQFQRDLIRYLETWELLSGDITNLESQLVHHPELQVVRYYTPAMVLQFELEFTILCSKLLSDEASRCFIPMLALSQNTAVSTECLLDPLDEQYNGECALITQIPTEMLYDPWKVAHQLCHEVSHYSGDATRNRLERKNVLCKCMAEWITRYWSEPYIDNIPSITNRYLAKFKNFCTLFNEKLFKIFQQTLGCDTDNQHLDFLIQRILLQCQSICNDPQLREEFQNNALSFVSEDEQLSFLGKKASIINGTAYSMSIELADLDEHLEYLKHCLKEGFADISMIMLLDCSNDEYVECVYSEEIERIYRNNPSIRQDELYELINRHIDRFALVYAARQSSQKRNMLRHIKKINIKKTASQTLYQKNNPAGWIQEAKARATNALLARQGNTDVYWNPDVANLQPNHLQMPEATIIINYLVSCIEDLKHFLGQKDKQREINRLRQVLKSVRPDFFDWGGLQSFLLQARKKRKEEYSKEASKSASVPTCDE